MEINSHDKFETIFWKVFHNRYILTQIFKIMKEDPIELNKYYLGHRRCFSKIRSLGWLLENDKSFMILKMKMRAKEKLIIERSTILKLFTHCNLDEETINLFFDNYYNEQSYGSVKWLIEKSIESGNVMILKYLISKYEFRIKRNLLRLALTSNSIQVIEYLYKVIEEQTKQQDEEEKEEPLPLTLLVNKVDLTDYDPDPYNFQAETFKKGVFLLALHNHNRFIMEYILNNPQLYERVDGYCKVSENEVFKISSPSIKIKILEMDLVNISNIKSFLFSLQELLYEDQDKSSQLICKNKVESQSKEDLIIETMKFYVTLVYMINNETKLEIPNEYKVIFQCKKYSNQEKASKLIEILIKEVKKNKKTSIDSSIIKYYWNELNGKSLYSLYHCNAKQQDKESNGKKKVENLFEIENLDFLSTFESCSLNGLQYLFEVGFDFSDQHSINSMNLLPSDFENGRNNSRVLDFLKLFNTKTKQLLEHNKIAQLKIKKSKARSNNKNKEANTQQSEIQHKIKLPDQFIRMVLSYCPIDILEAILENKLIPVMNFVENRDIYINSNSIQTLQWFIENKTIEKSIEKLSSMNLPIPKSPFYTNNAEFIVENENNIDFIIQLNTLKKNSDNRNNNKIILSNLFGKIKIKFKNLDQLKYYQKNTGESVSLMFLELFKNRKLIGENFKTIEDLIEWSNYFERDQYKGFTQINYIQLIDLYTNIYKLVSSEGDKELYQLIDFNISKFPAIDLLFNSLELSTIKLILENQYFNIENEYSQLNIQSYINGLMPNTDNNLYNTKFYDNHSKLNFTSIFSLAKYLLFKLSEKSIILFHHYFRKIYKRALTCPDATLYKVKELDELYRQFSVPLIGEFYHLYYYLKMKSTKLVKYIESAPVLKDYITIVKKYEKNEIWIPPDTNLNLNNSNFSINYLINNTFDDIFIKLRFHLTESLTTLNTIGYEKSWENDLNFLASIHNLVVMDEILLAIDYSRFPLKNSWLNKFYEKINNVFEDHQIQNLKTIISKASNK
ncbi:hypothetical protein DICPUDRAFT_80703 [Dictyostelium purpureum]|uniref:Uncharacterized protein n=1 Tax=Dictyostelium purpureum TaxID=5786 RepID=F0ZR98_DICPU|nr:uncharacterized protein DICPUDRAFT_80703 [Dictyostelium purpureum]EGC33522.1 hypothetical protein DICPUDRAFT_80703 [Dictyostelium purpureum]|eukprot:XP_003289947.1 hypothetical protein DICPUDRAFT_80703 [Dictyostelium purpureum]